MLGVAVDRAVGNWAVRFFCRNCRINKVKYLQIFQFGSYKSNTHSLAFTPMILQAAASCAEIINHQRQRRTLHPNRTQDTALTAMNQRIKQQFLYEFHIWVWLSIVIPGRIQQMHLNLDGTGSTTGGLLIARPWIKRIQTGGLHLLCWLGWEDAGFLPHQ